MENSLIVGADMTLIAMVLSLMTIFKTLFEKTFKKKVVKRFLPVLPVVLAVVLSAVGVVQGEADFKTRMIVGMTSGISAAYLFKLGKTTVMGNGLEEEDKKASKKEEV